ncbi:hypothetical protein F5B22DRAFT_644747 [Xylaria bambusicola]|uniref:uncharacterized protein n=1 Tax=Xylaria bambusicola TaxID=326684 RepID=UPI0020079D03|nr:uncharacterized protein F5B22DRAFT_644747 [Xylaria bambusicola]KAI0518439.1 hypothetical protein F5B22DRAFT_644747 [Xylaria bambusicola]
MTSGSDGKAETADLLPAWINPDLSRLLIVKEVKGDDFKSSAESVVDLPAGALFARISGVKRVPKPSWSSVQAGRDLHIELNSDLVKINHSCAPTLEWDMERMEIRVSRHRDLKKGDSLSFFYPSTEFCMAQPFQCWCDAGEDVCLGRISGAASIDPRKLDGYWINRHIKEMLEEASKKRNSHL